MQTTPSQTGAGTFSAVTAITTAHLTLIAVLAMLVVIAMIYGARLKRRRRIARDEERQRLDAYASEHPEAPAASPPPRPAAPTAPEVTVAGGEEPRVAAPPAPPLDPEDQQVTPAGVSAGAGAGTAALSDTLASDAPADGPVIQLKGLGPKVAARLAELGITRVGQLAALDDDAAGALDAQLGAFRGRMTRDRWVEQARFLAAGDRAGFEAVFGRL